MYYEDCELKDVHEFNKKKEMEVHVMVQHRKVSSQFRQKSPIQ